MRCGLLDEVGATAQRMSYDVCGRNVLSAKSRSNLGRQRVDSSYLYTDPAAYRLGMLSG